MNPDTSCTPVPDVFTIQQRWQQRSDHENTARNLTFLQQYCLTGKWLTSSACAQARWVFSHVPKTGGTTLEYILNKNVPYQRRLHINAPVINQQPERFGANGIVPRLIMGHHPMHGLIYQLLPAEPVFHFAIIRHPVARIVSWYNYVVSKKQHAMHRRVSALDFDDFLAQKDLVELRNAQCRRFTGLLHSKDSPDDENLFKNAWHVLNTAFSLVGTTERFDETLLLIRQHLGLQDIFYQRQNPSEKTISADTLRADQCERIMAMNRADAALHKAVDDRLSVLVREQLDSQAVTDFRQRQKRWQALLYSSNKAGD